MESAALFSGKSHCSLTIASEIFGRFHAFLESLVCTDTSIDKDPAHRFHVYFPDCDLIHNAQTVFRDVGWSKHMQAYRP